MLRLSSFCVQRRTMRAKFCGGYSGGYLDSQRGVLFPAGYFGGLEMALTDTEVRKSKPTAKAYRLSDSGGLYLWVTPAGGKLWRWGYKHEGKEKLMSFGQYPDVPLALA